MTAPLLPALPGYDDPQLIAHGTTALVFRAIQTRLNRPVAIKVIAADADAGAVPVNVERELATTVALSSQPHIVSIIDTGVTGDDRRYIVMEYCEGGSYAQILRQSGPLPVDDVVEVGIKIGQALHAAHEAGIVHRDVKPSNILRSRFGPALTDFGIARAPDELGSTLTREMMTPHHASPEALLHQAQSGLSDVYSLASTMWTLLVGHPPYVDPQRPDVDMYQFRDRVLHEPLPAMPRADVPAWLVTELHRAMAKLPARRHASARDFSEALQRGVLGMDPAPIPSEDRREAGTQPQPYERRAPISTTDRPEADTRPQTYEPPTPIADTAPAPAPDDGWHPPTAAGGWHPPTAAGGWHPPIDEAPSAWPDTSVERIRARPHRDDEVTAPSGGRRGGLLAVLAGAAVIAMMTGILLYLRFGRSAPVGAPPVLPTAPASSEAVTPTTITPVTEGAPTDVKIEDYNGTSATLTWTDPAGGTRSYVAVAYRSGSEEAEQYREVPAGSAQMSVTFTELDADADYCFTVGVIYSVTEVAAAPAVCTDR